MICPFKFNNYKFEGGQECIGIECGMHKLCANDTLAAGNDVSAASVDANDVNAMQDSRENMEADVRKEIEDYAGRFLDGEKILYELMVSMLDRQAAITEAEQREWWGGVVAELQARVDELTEDYKASSNGLEILTLKNAELQTQVNNLNSENAKLSSDELHLRNALAQSEHELATLRNKLGRMLDNAHEITRIGGDC